MKLTSFGLGVLLCVQLALASGVPERKEVRRIGVPDIGVLGVMPGGYDPERPSDPILDAIGSAFLAVVSWIVELLTIMFAPS